MVTGDLNFNNFIGGFEWCNMSQMEHDFSYEFLGRDGMSSQLLGYQYVFSLDINMYYIKFLL